MIDFFWLIAHNLYEFYRIPVVGDLPIAALNVSRMWQVVGILLSCYEIARLTRYIKSLAYAVVGIGLIIVFFYFIPNGLVSMVEQRPSLRGILVVNGLLGGFLLLLAITLRRVRRFLEEFHADPY